jgi:hypothetical protein
MSTAFAADAIPRTNINTNNFLIIFSFQFSEKNIPFPI